MSEPKGCAGGCPRTDTYCDRCDLLVGLPGLRVIKVHAENRRLVVTVESPPAEQGCRLCGVVAGSHGRRTVRLVDAPCFGRPVRIVWRKRTWECEEPDCPVGVFTEQHDSVARPRGLLTVRACWWAIRQLRFEHASVLGLARQLGTTWRTLWRSILPLLQQMADDPDRFDDVTRWGSELEIIPAPLSIDAGLEVGRELAGRRPQQRPTAVATAVDLLAIGVLHSLLAKGLRVPDDLSLAGYDDIPFASQLSVPLTTIARPHRQMGIAAADLLLSILDGHDPTTRHQLMAPQLLVRASTAVL